MGDDFFDLFFVDWCVEYFGYCDWFDFGYFGIDCFGFGDFGGFVFVDGDCGVFRGFVGGVCLWCVDGVDFYFLVVGKDRGCVCGVFVLRCDECGVGYFGGLVFVGDRGVFCFVCCCGFVVFG